MNDEKVKRRKLIDEQRSLSALLMLVQRLRSRQRLVTLFAMIARTLQVAADEEEQRDRWKSAVSV
jgi:hypothetical protein